jgi:hypothetical protein
MNGGGGGYTGLLENRDFTSNIEEEEQTKT